MTATGTLLVYVRLSDGGRVSSGSPLRWVVERLYRLKLTAGTTPHLIAQAKYPNDLDIRRFNDPRLSHGGSYLITSTTGSDISVSYMVRSSTTGHPLRTVKTALAGNEATAWSNHGNRVAFWSMPLADNTDTTRLLVYKPAVDTSEPLREAVEGRRHRLRLVVERRAARLQHPRPEQRERRGRALDDRSRNAVAAGGDRPRRRQHAGLHAVGACAIAAHQSQRKEASPGKFRGTKTLVQGTKVPGRTSSG